ncbi:hypothetical protein F5882DRAFT_17727 [Hyaloscypha sp. PMI_1271]|nr:hypothetical protein F5882DRAFT_17727 [Hyaloscypha sp. PMI_1271]
MFYILVEIRQGRFINHFSERGHSNRILPFDPNHLPAAFPIDTTNPEIYKKFYNKQWRFCAPDLKPITTIHYHPNQILPIISKEKIIGAGSAILYNIKVHSSYNKLGPQIVSTSKPPTNTFALKTYYTPNAKKYYDNEVVAFRKLKLVPKSGLIGFYGSFV